MPEHPVKARTRLFVFLAAVVAIAILTDQWRRTHLESSQDGNIVAAARRYGVEPALVKAVVWRESKFDPRARGKKGEIGLMQIMPDTAREWAGTQTFTLLSELTLFDAAKNIDCGVWYLGKLLARYRQADDAMPYALADYNAGRRNVLKWMKGSAATNSAEFMEQIDFPSTREYVRAVLQRRDRYAPELASRTK